MSLATRLRGLSEAAHRPIDIASLVVFRIAFGGIMAWEAVRYLGSDWIPRYFIDPTFHFTYMGFAFVQPWPGVGMIAHFIALGVLGVCVAAGLAYRLAAGLLTIGFTYIFLLDQANYLNHFYLVCLLSVLTLAIPAHRSLSLDALRKGPGWTRRHAPAWALWILRFQLGWVYLLAGVAKLNPDWLRAQPMLIWMENKRDLPVLGELIAADTTAWFLSYGGLLFDLLITPLLLWRRTRLAMFVVAVGFHLSNAYLFSIGIFPWLMIAASTLFFEPGWPRRWYPRFFAADPGTPPVFRQIRVVVPAIAVWVAVQVLVPFRHLLYPGSPSWTEEGHKFAWHMKLRTKSGRVTFQLRDPVSGAKWTVDPEHHLTARQARKMRARPDMILQFAHHLADSAREDGLGEVEVRARALVSLNTRPAQPIIDETVDLSKVEPRLWPPAEWILPLEEPLPGWDW